jgi:hypothetical protein
MWQTAEDQAMATQEVQHGAVAVALQIFGQPPQ